MLRDTAPVLVLLVVVVVLVRSGDVSGSCVLGTCAVVSLLLLLQSGAAGGEE